VTFASPIDLDSTNQVLWKIGTRSSFLATRSAFFFHGFLPYRVDLNKKKAILHGCQETSVEKNSAPSFEKIIRSAKPAVKATASRRQAGLDRWFSAALTALDHRRAGMPVERANEKLEPPA
jgi:hypothetical protein